MVATDAWVTSAQSVERAYRRIRASERPEVWIHLRDESDALRDADTVMRRLRAGESLPLAGMTVAVKDNIDVAGLPTTAGCPAFAYLAQDDATAVARLRTAGAIVLGKTNLDQFATGLTGTRSPYGAVRDSRDVAKVSGGSSSGSAVAVALGQVDLGVGTDTAGSGRVPAAFQGVVGVKPTVGLVPVRGVVAACRSFDCVSMFADSVATAVLAARVMAGNDRIAPRGLPTTAPERPRIATMADAERAVLSPAARAALSAAHERWEQELGAELVEIDLDVFLAAGRLLYEGAFVSERYAAVGEFIEAHRDAVDPDVATIILGGGRISAVRYADDVALLGRYRAAARDALHTCDALLLPTAPFQPTIAEVRADPMECNRQLGRYTTFANLLDLCALALPAGAAGDGRFGVTLLAPAFHDAVLADLGARFAAISPEPRAG